MFDLNTYQKDCDRLTLSRDTLEEMIVMTEQKKTKGFRPVRVALLAAALVAALSITAAATDGPIKDMIQEFFVSYTFTEKSDGVFGFTSDEGLDMGTAIEIPTMAYTEKDGRKIFTLNGEEIDVTAAMEKDGYYEQELEGATLRVTADGVATITVADITYTVGLTEEGAVSSFDMDSYSYWEAETDDNGNIVDGDPDEADEVKDAYKITEKDGELVVTDSEGNVVDTSDIPQE